MKPRSSNQGNHALTITEVLVVIVVLVIIGLVLLPAISLGPQGPRKMTCVTNLKQISLAYTVWAGDHGDQYPMQLSTANWGAKELAMNGDVVGIFCTMSNELVTPKVLVCPEDIKCAAANNFAVGFSDANISYFVSLDANHKSPQMILSGDDNFVVNGKPIQSGVLNLWTNASVKWTFKRHHYAGNIALADGSVQTTSSSFLRQMLVQTGVATNRLALP